MHATKERKWRVEMREKRREREREKGDAASVELQFRAGWSVAAATTTLPLPPFVLRLNVTIITGKAVHTHAGNRGGTRNYIDISIASPDGLIN